MNWSGHIMEVNTMKIKNVFERLQMVRVELQQVEMKKSGKNTFSKYDYFELADFLPQVNELCNKHRITPVVIFNEKEAKLTVYNQDDKDDYIEFTSPFLVCELKGSNRLQALGSAHSYLRRYLYLTAFEIIESDGIDGLPEEARKEVPQVDETQQKLLAAIMKNKDNQDLQQKLREEMKTHQAKSIKELSTESLTNILKVVMN